MTIPAMAKKTFDELRSRTEFIGIVEFILLRLKKLTNPIKRARFVHQIIDEYNEEVFSHQLVQEMSPCKRGCTACCHTQVSVTEDEAILLGDHVRRGLKIDTNRLKLQMVAGNDSQAFYKIRYEDRKCVFLGENGACQVYEDRPSVCRTNAVLGNSSQCDTRFGIQLTRLVRTPKADMVIYGSFLYARSAGTLPAMLGKILKR